MMDFSDVRKKLEDARRTSLTKHYKVSVAAVVDACLALVEAIEDQEKDTHVVSEEPRTSEEMEEIINKQRGGPRTFGTLPPDNIS